MSDDVFIDYVRQRQRESAAELDQAAAILAVLAKQLAAGVGTLEEREVLVAMYHRHERQAWRVLAALGAASGCEGTA